MAKRKREIDFIAAQKMLGKTGQTTSFEFILVVTVVVVAAAMVGWFLIAKKQNDSETELLAADKTTLEQYETDYGKNYKRFEEYLPIDTGKTVWNSKTGKFEKIYEYKSIGDVATELAAQINAANTASTEVKGTIDLTSAIIELTLAGARFYDCEMSSFYYNDTEVRIVLSASDAGVRDDYIEYMEGKKGVIFGYDPSQYINSVSQVSSANTASGVRFELKFKVFSDVLLSDVQ